MKMVQRIKCDLCGYDIANTQIKKHKTKCGGIGPKKIKIEKLKGKGPGQGWCKGKKLKDVFGEERAKEIGEIISKALIGKSTGKAKNFLKELERKNKISKKMIGNLNWENSVHVSGRGKKGKYKGHFFASSWELAFIIYHIDHNIKFERNWEKFEYINKEGKRKFYIPDFIVDDVYVEVKGYVTENVILKEKYFPHTLIRYDKEGIKKFLNYVIEKYGKNFVTLKD